MIKGSTVIFNESYLSELERHKSNLKRKLDYETSPYIRQDLERQYDNMCYKIDKATEFQDVVDEVINFDVPRIAMIKTVGGLALPLSNVQII